MSPRTASEPPYPRWSVSVRGDGPIFGQERLLAAVKRLARELPRGEKLRHATWMAPTGGVGRKFSFWRLRDALVARPCEGGRDARYLEHSPRGSNWSVSVGEQDIMGLGLKYWVSLGSRGQPPSVERLRTLFIDLAAILGDAISGNVWFDPCPREELEDEWTPRQFLPGGTFFKLRDQQDGPDLPWVYSHLSPKEGGPPHMPDLPGWMAWWSDRACEALGYKPGEPLPVHSTTRIPDGGVIVQVTEEPYDPRRAEHRRTMRNLFDALPELGNRNPRSRWPRRGPGGWRQFGFYQLEFHFACPPHEPGDRRPLDFADALEALYASLGPEVVGRWMYRLNVSRSDPWWLRKPPSAGQTSLFDTVEERAAHFLDAPSGGVRAVQGMRGADGLALYGRFFPRPDPGYLLLCLYTPSIPLEHPASLAWREPERILEIGARTLGAWWACAFDSPTRIAAEQAPRADDRDPFPDFLPKLRTPADQPDVFTPAHLGWVNWWSRAACERVGFPDEGSALPFVRQVRETPDGGRVFRLKDEPLAIHVHEEDRELLAAAYQHFKGVGGRAE